MKLKEIRRVVQKRYSDETTLVRAIERLSEDTMIPIGTLNVVLYGHMTLDAERAKRLADVLGIELIELMPMLKRDAQYLLRT